MRIVRVIIASVAAVGMMAVTSCNTTKTVVAPPVSQEPVMVSELDTVSYALGVNIGINLKENLKTFPDGPVNMEVFTDILVKALKGDTTLMMNSENAQNRIQQYVMAVQQRETEALKAEGEKFLAENKTKEGVVTTESGLQYKVLTEGSGDKPTEADRVKVHYTGKLLDGTVFDSSVQRGEPTTFGVTQVIRGWQEVLQLMPVGAKYLVWIPSELAYGANGAGQMIKPHATLEFEVELLEIIQPERAEDAEK